MNFKAVALRLLAANFALAPLGAKGDQPDLTALDAAMAQVDHENRAHVTPDAVALAWAKQKADRELYPALKAMKARKDVVFAYAVQKQDNRLLINTNVPYSSVTGMKECLTILVDKLSAAPSGVSTNGQTVTVRDPTGASYQRPEYAEGTNAVLKMVDRYVATGAAVMNADAMHYALLKGQKGETPTGVAMTPSADIGSCVQVISPRPS